MFDQKKKRKKSPGGGKGDSELSDLSVAAPDASAELDELERAIKAAKKQEREQQRTRSVCGCF